MNSDKINPFGLRLLESFDYAPNNEIAAKLGITKSAVSAYMKGRIPPGNKLIKISRLTGCNLHWLLTGIGEKKINAVESESKILMFQGGKGGVGTTVASMLTGIVLATKGYRTLLISNKENLRPYLFSLNKIVDSKFSPQSVIIADSDKFTSTSIQNLDVFTEKGSEFITYFEKQTESVKKSEYEIKKEYQYIIFDFTGFPDFLTIEKFALKSLLLQGSLIIPYEISNSSVETVSKILNTIALGRIMSATSFLGLFINKKYEDDDNFVKKYYEVKLNTIRDLIGNKIFKNSVRYDAEALNDFALNSDLKKLKNTHLFIDYSGLVDEILERLNTEKQ